MNKTIKAIELESSNIDFYKTLVKKFIKHWYWFAISIFTSLSIGLLISKSTMPQYKNNLLMLFSDATSRQQQRNSEDLMKFEMFDVQGNIEDELGVITSFPVINETVKKLNLAVSYYVKSGLITKELYKSSPFFVVIDAEYSQPIGLLFEVEILSDEKFRLIAKTKEDILLFNFAKNEVSGVMNGVDLNKEYSFGDQISMNDIKFKILMNGDFNPMDYQNVTLSFEFNDLEELTYQYQANLIVGRVSTKSSLVTCEFTGGNANLVTDFLNELAAAYLEINLSKKNKIANKTIRFIEEQITNIADSLGYTSSELKDFRTKNKVMDINFLSQTVYVQMRDLQNQKAELMVKSKYYDYIKEYFENNADITDMMAPSAMGVEDEQLTALLNELTKLNASRSLNIENQTFKNMNLSTINAQIKNLKNTILEQIDYIVKTSIITINYIDNRIAKLGQEIDNLPGIENELININRNFTLNDAIYTFLLTKRSESQIARASNSPDYEIINPAKLSSAIQVAPKKMIILATSFILGLMLPIGLILLLSAINESITEIRDIDKITNFPLLGSIAENDRNTMLPILDFPKSLISESFRSARTSLQFFHKGQPKQKILVTSSMSGDGKTFISMNLAAAYSNYGKRTLIIEFDLRNPKIADYMGLDRIKGLTSYLINDARLEEIIQKTSMKNLDVIPAGEVPPNPVELIASDNTKNMIEILQTIYDYIIIDTPPLGLVTDSFLLMEHSDANIFVVRINHTSKNLFSNLTKDLQQKEIANVTILINNDENKTQSSYYDDSIRKMSYIQRKIYTLKKLIRPHAKKAY